MPHRKRYLPPASVRHVVFPVEGSLIGKAVDFAVPARLPAASAADFSLPDAAAEFIRWLLRQIDVDFEHYRPETLARRLTACLRSLRVATVEEARRLLQQRPQLLAIAIDAMLVGVTSFFRDPEVFATLAESVLPDMGRGRAGLHVWSAGCSDGAELYSIGMIFAPLGWLASSYLLGTDCRGIAIQHARAGWFDAAACATAPPGLAAKYLEPHGDRVRASALLRTGLRWRVGNLLHATEPGIWDVILCRNTAMYLHPDATTRLWRQLETALRPGGLLVVGKAERPLGAKNLEPLAPCLYRRKRGYK
jgi:chemotaxis protein methyltransferase CheR